MCLLVIQIFVYVSNRVTFVDDNAFYATAILCEFLQAARISVEDRYLNRFLGYL